MVLKLLRPPGGRADAHQEHARRERVQGAGVADFEIFLAEVLDGGELDLAHHVGGSPAPRLVDGEDDSFGIIRNMMRQRHQRQVILSMRR